MYGGPLDDGYSKTYKPKRGQSWGTLGSSPKARLVVLVLAVAGLAFTFTTGMRSAEEAAPGSWVSRRSALEQEPGDSRVDQALQHQAAQQQPAEQAHWDQAQQQQQQQAGQQAGPHDWANRRVTTLDHQTAHALSQQPTAHAASQETFNPALHQLYLQLPPLQESTHYVLAGGWQLTRPIYDYSASHPAAEVLSWDKPRVVLFRSFMSPEEVQYLIDISAARMERSQVLTVAGQDGTQTVDNSRTSFGAWPPQDDEVVMRVQDRIHRLLAIPKEFGEGMYVLRYQHMQQYRRHNDHCMDGWGGKQVADGSCLDFVKRGGGPGCGPGHGGPSCGDRVATFIMYLKSPTKGGATVFPMADLTNKRMAAAGKTPGTDEVWYCREEEVLGVRPAPGDAVLFWDYVPGTGAGTGSYQDGSADPSAQTVTEALHSGCPVLEGEKWISTRWIRGAGFDYHVHHVEGHAATAA